MPNDFGSEKDSGFGDPLEAAKVESGNVGERLMEIGRQCASHAPADWLTRDFDEELYDERGLPWNS
jgi:hypothetical protein